MAADGQEFIFKRFVALAAATVQFASALDRSVIGSMNELVLEAELWLVERELSPFDVGFQLNEMPLSYLRYANPRKAFKALGEEKFT